MGCKCRWVEIGAKGEDVSESEREEKRIYVPCKKRRVE